MKKIEPFKGICYILFNVLYQLTVYLVNGEIGLSARGHVVTEPEVGLVRVMDHITVEEIALDMQRNSRYVQTSNVLVR